MHGQDIGTGAALVGFGVLFVVVAIMFKTPILLPFSYALIGAGGALFLRGFAHGIRWSLPFLLTLGFVALIMAGVLFVTRRHVLDGLALASMSLGWSLALVAVGMYRQANATPQA